MDIKAKKDEAPAVRAGKAVLPRGGLTKTAGRPTRKHSTLEKTVEAVLSEVLRSQKRAS